MQFANCVASMASFGSHSNAFNYTNESFNQNIGSIQMNINNENQISNNSTQMLRQSIRESESTNTIPLLTSDLPSSQWLLNPFCSSAPLMATTVSATHSGLNSSELVSLLNSNFLCSANNSSQLSGLSLRTSIDAALASVTSASNTSNKEIVRFKTCCLYPPKPNTPIATTRERPLGCRTVFVGGLPENISEDILQEVFQQICGDICAIRMSKKNFCHIRFDNENAVDNAIAISGYRLKINDLEDSPNTGRLHIDYAQARDDQYDWECKQRALQREMRHRERLEYDRFCPPSPPTVHFSDHEALQLIDRLKGDQTFLKAVQVLISWLERGECQKRNSGQFYAMIQSTNNHIRRLQNERTLFENEWLNARQLYHTRMQSILVQFSQIEKVFEAAVRQKAWDHFTKAQRKHIDVWFKQTKELKNAQVNDVVNKREEDEMDLSDGEPDSSQTNDVSITFQALSNNSDSSNSIITESSEMKLRDENDSLLCQVESFRNEAVFVQAESRQEKENLEKQIQILQKALQGMQHQLISLSQQKREDDLQINRLKKSLNQNLLSLNSIDSNLEKTDQTSRENNCDITNSFNNPLLISLMSIYFNAHPYGVTSDHISLYLKHQSHIQDFELLTPNFIELFLVKYPQLFSQLESDSSGKKLWRFCGFQSKNLNN